MAVRLWVRRAVAAKGRPGMRRHPFANTTCGPWTGTAHAPQRPRETASIGALSSAKPVIERQAVPGGGAVCGAEQRRLQGGARSALRQHICRSLFERSERSERSEFCGTPCRRAAQGSRRAALRPPEHPNPNPTSHTPEHARPHLTTPTHQAKTTHRSPSARPSAPVAINPSPPPHSPKQPAKPQQ